MCISHVYMCVKYNFRCLCNGEVWVMRPHPVDEVYDMSVSRPTQSWGNRYTHTVSLPDFIQYNTMSGPWLSTTYGGTLSHKNTIVFQPDGHVVMATEEDNEGRYDPDGAVFASPPQPASQREERVEARPPRRKEFQSLCSFMAGINYVPPLYGTHRGLSPDDTKHHVKNSTDHRLTDHWLTTDWPTVGG